MGVFFAVCVLLGALGASGQENDEGASTQWAMSSLYGEGARYKLDGGVAVGRGKHSGAVRLTGALTVKPLHEYEDMLLIEFEDVVVEQQSGIADWKRIGGVGGQWGARLVDGNATLYLDQEEDGGVRDIKRAIGALLLGASGRVEGIPWGDCTSSQWPSAESRRMQWQCADDITRVWRYQLLRGTLDEIVSEEMIPEQGSASVRSRCWLRLSRSLPLPPPHAGAIPALLTPHGLLFEALSTTKEEVSEAESWSLLRALTAAAEAGAGGGEGHARAALLIVRALREGTKQRLNKLMSSCPADLQPALLHSLGQCGSEACRAVAAAELRLSHDAATSLALQYFHGLALAYRPQESVITWALDVAESTRDEAIRTAALLAGASAGVRAGDAVKEGVTQRVLKGLAKCGGEGCKELYVRALGQLGATTALLQHATSALPTPALAAIHALRTQPQPLLLRHCALLLRLALDQPPLTEGRRTLEVRAEALLLAIRSASQQLPAGGVLLLSAARALGASTAPGGNELRRLYWAALAASPASNITREMPADVLAQIVYAVNGTSDTFTRTIWSDGDHEAVLTADTVASSGLLRQQSVSVADRKGELVRVDVWARGLHAMAGGEGDEEEEVAAGIELSVRSSPLPPITLFEGQGALLAALWAGTGSDNTPVLRATHIQRLEDKTAKVMLGALHVQAREGDAIALDARGTASLWSRTARARLTLRAARYAHTQITASTPWSTVSSNHTESASPSLHVAADLDFYSTPVLCVRAHTQPYDLQANHTLVTPRFKRQTAATTARVARTFALDKQIHDACRDIAHHDDDD